VSGGRHHHFPRFGKRKQAKLPTLDRREVEDRMVRRWAVPFASLVEREMGTGARVMVEAMMGYAGHRARLYLWRGAAVVVVQVDERYARGDHAAARVAASWTETVPVPETPA
jgi:hypothetical protein